MAIVIMGFLALKDACRQYWTCVTWVWHYMHVWSVWPKEIKQFCSTVLFSVTKFNNHSWYTKWFQYDLLSLTRIRNRKEIHSFPWYFLSIIPAIFHNINAYTFTSINNVQFRKSVFQSSLHTMYSTYLCNIDRKLYPYIYRENVTSYGLEIHTYILPL